MSKNKTAIIRTTESKSNNSGKSLVIIPLLPSDVEYQARAVAFVDDNLEFSINKLHLEDYTQCTSDYETAIFASEVIRCMIMSDIYAKKTFYEGLDIDYTALFRNPPTQDDFDTMTSQNYSTRIYNSLTSNSKYNEELLLSYQILSIEDNDILRGDNRLHVKAPEIQVACLISESQGFLGMIYTLLKKNENEDGVFQQMFNLPVEKDMKNKPINIMEIYGVRSSPYSYARGVATNLITGVAKYCQSLHVRIMYVNRQPLGVVRQLLPKLGFNDSRYVDVNTVSDKDGIAIVNMGCKKEILAKKSKWFHPNYRRLHYQIKHASDYESGESSDSSSDSSGEKSEHGSAEDSE